MGCATDVVIAAAVISTALAENQSVSYLNFMGNLLSMVGQNLSTIADAKALDEQRCSEERN